MPPCANCQRLQAQLDALQARFEALEATVAQLQRQLAAARKDSSNSSKPPSSDIVKPPKPPPPPGQERRQPGGQPGHASHQRESCSRPRCSPPSPTDYLLDACPSCGGHLLLTDDAEPIVVQQVDIAAVPAGDPRAPQPSGVVSPLPEDLLRPVPAVDRARRPGRAATDHRHRLPQGGLSRLVLDHPQVHPRRDRLDHLAGAIGQDHRQGQPGAGTTL